MDTPPAVPHAAAPGAVQAVALAPPGAGWVRWFAPALVATLAADLLSKEAVFALGQAHGWPTWIELHQNRGVAWSGFADHPWVVAVLTAVLIPILVAVWWVGYRRLRIDNLAFGLILGGALGNAHDRLLARLGHLDGVRDFLHVDLGVWPANPWPTFNLADAAICVGFALILLVPHRWRAATAPGAA